MSRKGLVVLAAVFALSGIGVGPGALAKPRPRTEVVPYSHAGELEADMWIARCGGSGFGGGALGLGNAWETANFAVERGETSMAIRVADQAPGQQVMAFVQYEDRNDTWTTTIVCGSTVTALPVEDDQFVTVGGPRRNQRPWTVGADVRAGRGDLLPLGEAQDHLAD